MIKSKILIQVTVFFFLSLNISIAKSIDEISETFLEEAGYFSKIEKGFFKFTPEDFCNDLFNCFGNNPTSPYGITYFDNPENIILLKRFYVYERAPFWKLSEREAVVLILNTPLSTDYFGITGYIFNKQKENFKISKRKKNRKNFRRKKLIFASLGDSFNNLNIKTDQVEGNKIGAVIMSPDKNIVNRAISALKNSGLSENSINVLTLDHEKLKLGPSKRHSNIGLLMRVANFDDKAERESYLSAPPIKAFKLTLKPEYKEEPFKNFNPRTKRGTDKSEGFVLDAFNLLANRMKERLRARKEPSIINHLDLSGEKCIEEMENCLGDNSDVLYSAISIGKLAEDEDVFVFGINHASTGKAIYSNIVIYNQLRLAGIGAITNKDFEGSLERFLPNSRILDLPFAKHLYIYKISRNCDPTDKYCFQVNSEGPFSIPLKRKILIAKRAYLERETGTGPLASEILPSRFIKIKASGRTPDQSLNIPHDPR